MITGTKVTPEKKSLPKLWTESSTTLKFRMKAAAHGYSEEEIKKFIQKKARVWK